MPPPEESHSRDLSPSGRTGRRTDAHDEHRGNRGGSGFHDAAGDHQHDRRAGGYDHRQRTRYEKGQDTEKNRDGEDFSDERNRWQHASDAEDGQSGRRRDADIDHRRNHGTDDLSRGRSRHVADADADTFGAGRHHREYRHREGSTRERNFHGSISDRDKRGGYEDGDNESGHKHQYGKQTTRINNDRYIDENIGRDRFAPRAGQRNEEILPELFSVHRAKVQSVRPFGVFVRLEGFYKQGLVHVSQLSDHEVTDREDSDEMKVKAIAAVAGEGDQVWVKVISLKSDGGSVKIGCSLKLVSQSSGKDLDPNNLKLNQQQTQENRPEIKKVTLDAIYNVVCTRCGGHGHLKSECYTMGDKNYELIPEDESVFEAQPAQEQQIQSLLERTIPKPGFGRGRAMVLPAWMTHGTGADAVQMLGSENDEKRKRKVSELPDEISTVEEAKAFISEVKKAKKDKHRHKGHRKHRDKKSRRSKRKHSSSRKDVG